jgi:hypothetical protein
MVKKSEQLKHIRICNQFGLEVIDKPICSEKLRVPFKISLNQKVADRLKALVDYQKSNPRLVSRKFYYNLLQEIDPKIRLEPLKEFKGKDPYERAYESIITLVNKARFGGLIPFDSVIDQSDLIGIQQNLCSLSTYLEEKADSFRSNWFENQPCYLEVWLEKRSDEEIVQPITDKLGVYLSCSGKEPSWSQIYNGIGRFTKFDKDKNFLLYIGDLDPDGKYMIEFIKKAFVSMSERYQVPNIKVVPIALNINQVNSLNLYKIRPLKTKSTNLDWFKRTFKIDYYTELDALNTVQLQTIVEQEIKARLDYNEILMKKHLDDIEIQKVKVHLKAYVP